MYGHGITTLMLSEMLGMGADTAQDELIRTKCRWRHRTHPARAKNAKDDLNRGGWRYTPDSGDSDMSVTVWQTMALRAARNAGLDVPKEAIDDAVHYIKRLYDSAERQARQKRGFGYQDRGARNLHHCRGSARSASLRRIRGGGSRAALPSDLFKEGIKPGERWFFYATYYYAQGMYQRGGKFAEQGRCLVTASLLPLQSPRRLVGRHRRRRAPRREDLRHLHGGSQPRGEESFSADLSTLRCAARPFAEMDWPSAGSSVSRAAARLMPIASLKYHPNVAGILRNPTGEILICERADKSQAWQFPQGGIDQGETAEEALRRELIEEISVRDGYEIVARKGPYRYVYDGCVTKRGYQGKEQEYFLLNFTGDPGAINLQTAHPEFTRARWILPPEFQLAWLPPMKIAVYQSVFFDFFGLKLPLPTKNP